MTDTSTTCPIWGTPATKIQERDYGDKVAFDSVRAGGKFEVSGTASSMIGRLPESEKAILTTWIVDQNRLGNVMPMVHSGVLEKLSEISPLGVAERRDRLVSYLGRKVRRLGSSVQLAGIQNEQQQRNVCELMAWTECIEEKELWYLIEFGAEEKYIKKTGSGGTEVVLTPKGYEHLDQLLGSNTSSSQAFVAMWFHDSMSKAYAEGFAEAIRDAGYKPLRIDQKEHVNKIDDEIVAEIRRSRFLVADFTAEPDKPRGGVYFEAGFAYGLNIPVIWTCREDAIADVHFDTRQFNHIVWKSPEDLCTKLKNRIEAVIGEGPLKLPE